jgi:sarcosine oxidase subunit gamma
VRDFAAIGIVTRREHGREVIATLSHHLGATVVDGPKRICSADLALVGTAPGQWLAIERNARANGALNVMRRELCAFAAVSDQGDGRVILEFSGPRARDALAKGIPLDLHPRAFKLGDAAQTAAAHIGLQIALCPDGATFEIVSASSTAISLWAWLTSSAAEFGLEVL